MTFVSRTVHGLLLAMAAAVTAPAGAAEATLIGAADGASFTVGGTPYQVVTSARAERGNGDPAARSAAAGAASPSAVTVGTIGDYTITLPAAGSSGLTGAGAGSTAASSGTPAPQSTVSGSATTADYLVAVNRRTGSPVLVSNHLKLFGVSTAQAASVASSTGGAVDSLIAAASMAMLVYPSPAAALAAKTAIESQQGGGQAAIRVEPEVIQAFKTPR